MSGHLAARKRTPSLLLPSSRPKSSKPRGKGSALQEATEVAPKAVTSSGDAPADTGASSRRSRSPSLPKDDALRRAGAQSWHRG
ncbi:hypothetical protein PC128_g27793 [Phytophthora cactorum]|nr:hypothetical protein PC128_g27793 [Phytophthora cactorum]